MGRTKAKPEYEQVMDEMGLTAHEVAARVFSATDLMNEELPALKWTVPDILPEGLTLLGGKPKMGKSWMAMGIAVAIASGGVALGTRRVERGTCLYLALEDNKRRLQRRLRKLLSGGPVPAELHFATKWDRLDEGGAAQIENWIKDNLDARLVIIDTLKKIRPRGSGQRNIYDEDYEALEPVLQVANEYGVSILVVHHLRQLPADDPLDEFSGSTGLTGGVDGALVLRRKRGEADAFLSVSGRDIEEENEYALQWDHDAATWAIVGDAEEYLLAENPRKILQALKGAGKPIGPKDISFITGIDYNTVRNALFRMRDEDLVTSPKRGLWTPYSTTTANAANIANNAHNTNTANNWEGIRDEGDEEDFVSSDDEPANNDSRVGKPTAANVSNVSAEAETLSPEAREVYEFCIEKGLNHETALTKARTCANKPAE